jgi:asparagine synthase (glutamine-hydrolysing)
MCGIVAIYSREEPIPAEVLERATKSLYHRGPDGQRYWISLDGRVGLGHARLSIIDLTTGDQPIANEDETLRIVVNGELYDYESIQRELEQSGHRLRTRSDSEVALHLYEDLGAHCLHRLRGEFAFVLWDSVHRTMFAARDRFGIKPLFYAFHNGAIYFASEAKALFAAGIPRRWDGASVYNCAGVGGHQACTLFDGIYQLPPGHYMLATDNHVQVSQYWDFNYPRIEDAGRQRSDAEYAEEFRDALDEAVRVRLRADVPVGCYLSGGIDSCAVLGLAARHHSGPVRAFTLTFDRAEYNEGEIAREMAAKAHAEFCPIPIQQDDLAEHFFDAILQSETLCVNAHGVAKYLLSRSVRDAGYKVVLTGEGSDEILAGYQHFRRDVVPNNGSMKHSDAIGDVPPGTEELSHSTSGFSPADRNGQTLDTVKRLLGFVPGWMGTSFTLSAKMHTVLAQEFLATFNRRDDYRAFFNDIDVPGQLTGREPLNQSLYLWSKTRLPKYLLALLGDRMEMGHSVEGRLPFLDHHLVELVCSQPITQKIRGAMQKYVLKESLRDLITTTVYRRPKHPFLAPPASLEEQGQLCVLMQDTLRGPTLASIPFFDQRKIVKLLDELKTTEECSRVANDQVLMMILSACVLQDGFRLSA